MSLSLSQTATAVGAGIQASFLGAGGVEPYVYSVVDGGAGGTINSSSGLYVAPSAISSNPKLNIDTVQVIDSQNSVATTTILIGTPLLLFCDILQNQLGLDSSHIYLWDQKLFQPKDETMYIAVSVARCKPFASVNAQVGSSGGFQSQQFLSMMATLDIDIISRGPEARDRKEEVLLVLYSNYSQQQQVANSFNIGRLPAASSFINLSMIDGAAIPYRFKISVNMQYAYTKNQAVDYFDTFEEEEILENP